MNTLSKVLLIVLAILAILYAFFAVRSNARVPHVFFEDANGVLVISHQGGDFLWPSNTLFAFEQSVALGVDILELDVHASKDAELVVIHDDTLERTTNGSGLVREKTLAELKSLDAGFDWSPERKGESFPYRGQGITVPTLRELFEAFPNEKMTIEMKQLEPSIAGSLCDLIRAYGLASQVLVNSFHVAALNEFRGLCPEVATSTSAAEVRNAFILTSLFLGRLYPAPAEAFQVPEVQGSLTIVTPRLVRLAESKNMNLQVWTVNETADMERLVAMGVDGIITDRPDRLLRVLGRLEAFELPEAVPE